MENTEVKEYFSAEDNDMFALFFIDKFGLTYGQAIQVVSMLSDMINVAATRIAKDMGAI